MVIAKRFWHVQNFNETMELEGGAWATGKIVENYAKWVQFHSEAASFFKLSFHKLQVYVRKWFCEKKIVLVIEKKILKFEAEGREFANILRSLEQYVRTVKGQNNFW